MKVGSLVVCVKSSPTTINHKPTIKDKVYTVRDIQKIPRLSGVGLLFEEITNPINVYSGFEFDYEPSRFREIDCPPSIDIEEIIELEQV